MKRNVSACKAKLLVADRLAHLRVGLADEIVDSCNPGMSSTVSRSHTIMLCCMQPVVTHSWKPRKRASTERVGYAHPLLSADRGKAALMRAG